MSIYIQLIEAHNRLLADNKRLRDALGDLVNEFADNSDAPHRSMVYNAAQRLYADTADQQTESE